MAKKSCLMVVFFLFILVQMFQSVAMGQDGAKSVFAVNCGGGAFTSSDGTVYAADTGASGGATHSSDTAISGTTDAALFQSERYGNSTYSLKVPNGNYKVTLFFAETYHEAAGLRKFDVVMEGAKSISGLDIYDKAGGRNVAYTTTVSNVNVGDEELNIEFATVVENAKINAIKVVLDGPGAAFSHAPKMPIQGQIINFDASASSNPKGFITSYSWDFGDGVKATGETASHSFPISGEYKVTLEVAGSAGGSGSLTKTIKVYTGEPITDLSITPSSPEPGDVVKIDASASFDIDGTITRCHVDYGDGQSSTNPVSSHTYPNKGKYQIILTLTDNSGQISTLLKELLVRDLMDFDNFTPKVSMVMLDNINTFKVETAMGTFHWECDPGKSGWMSAFDNDGKDWIQAGPKGRGVGVNSQFRGLPNSGADDWGHPSRNMGHRKANVTSKVVGPSEGDKIVIESGGNTITARWHCFNTHIAMEVLELDGKYHFLWEGTPGGTIHTEEGVITADGEKRPIKEGWFAETPDWPAGENGEWFIITDPKKKFNMWMAQTPATNDKGELWYQGGNMDLASFGRPDNQPTFTDTERMFAWGFVPYQWDFEVAKEHIETILKNPLQEKK